MKDYPGAWAEYRVFEGGILQVHRRISTPEALGLEREDQGHVRRGVRLVRLGALEIVASLIWLRD